VKKTKESKAPDTSASSTKTTTPPVVAPEPRMPARILPPEDLHLPPLPPGFVPSTSTLRGVKPRRTELTVLKQVLRELRRFSNYDQLFGATAPDYASLVTNVDAALQWSSMRVALANWDLVCASYEQMSWVSMRREMKRLRPAFDLAAKNTPELTTRFVGLTHFLRAMSEIGRKGVASRRANKAAEAEGKPPVRGRRAKAAQRKQEKAALAKARA